MLLEAGSQAAAPTLRSARVVLTPWQPHQALSLLAVERELGADPLRLDDAVRTLDDALALTAWYADVAASRFGLGAWRVADVATDDTIGSVSLVPADGEVEFGGRFLRRAWGRWLGVHVGRLVLDHAFGPAGLARIATHHHPHNLQATAVVRRLGFVDHGIAAHFGRPARRFMATREAWVGHLRNEQSAH